MDYKSTKVVNYDDASYARVHWIADLFNRYEDYYRDEVSRIIRNERMYWGINFGQWPAYTVEKMKAQGQRPHQYNIIGKKIESQIGSYIANGFDMKFMTVDGKKSEWAMHLQDMAYSDKSNCDWETSEIIALRDMFVMAGYERMFISDRYDSDFGNIAWEPLRSTHVYISPSWKTPNAWDITDYFEWGRYRVSEIVDMFPKKKDDLKDWRSREEYSGIDFGEYQGGVQRYVSTDQKWGDYHRVITFHHVVKKERMWEYDLVNRCLFPETGFEAGTKEDKEAKQQYMQEFGVQEGQYTTVRQIKREKRIEVVCPTLHNEMFLASGKDRIQTNNCNIYPLGNNFYGQFRGVVDDLHDLQIDFNKGQMNILDVQARSAKGAFGLDEALAGGDEAKKREIESRWNDSSARIWLAEGTTAELGPRGGILEFPSSPPSPDMFNQSSRTLDLADWLSQMPAAMDSRSESTTESGKLYQSKVQVGLISQKYGMKIWERHKREKTMAYVLQAKLTYSGYPRSFSKSGGDALEINRTGADPIGRKVMINDITKMPEMKVLLVPSTSGINMRTELRAQYTEVLQLLRDPKDRLLVLEFVGGVFETQDMPEEKKKNIEKIIKMLQMDEAMAISMRLAQGKMQMQQHGMGDIQGDMPAQGAGATPNEGFDEGAARTGTPQDLQLIDQGATE